MRSSTTIVSSGILSRTTYCSPARARRSLSSGAISRPGAGVTVGPPRRFGLLALGVELLGGLEGAVRLPLRDQAVGGGAVEVVALATGGRGPRRTRGRATPSPTRICAGQLVLRALDVRVLDAQDERALLPPREEQVVERGARAADVQGAGRRGREADARSGRVRQGLDASLEIGHDGHEDRQGPSRPRCVCARTPSSWS